jgi:hypothetical protein
MTGRSKRSRAIPVHDRAVCRQEGVRCVDGFAALASRKGALVGVARGLFLALSLLRAKDGENQDKLVAGATKTTLTLAGAIATSHGHGDIAVMIALLKDNAPDAAVHMARYVQRECQARLPFCSRARRHRSRATKRGGA